MKIKSEHLNCADVWEELQTVDGWDNQRFCLSAQRGEEPTHHVVTGPNSKRTENGPTTAL